MCRWTSLEDDAPQSFRTLLKVAQSLDGDRPDAGNDTDRGPQAVLYSRGLGNVSEPGSLNPRNTRWNVSDR
jgi:hypothetical protein